MSATIGTTGSAQNSTSTDAVICAGVPEYKGFPAIDCEELVSLDDDGLGVGAYRRAFRRCERCDALVIERQQSAGDRQQRESRLAALAHMPLHRDARAGRRTLDTFRTPTPQHETALKTVREWLDGGPGVYLHGSCGVGKTFLSEAATVELAMRGESVEIANFGELSLAFQESFRDGHASQSDLVARYATAPFLVLDDFAGVRTTRYVIDSFYLLLTRRIRDERPTLIAANYGMKDLAVRLVPERPGVLSDGEADKTDARRVVERVLELCPSVVEITAKSERVARAKKVQP